MYVLSIHKHTPSLRFCSTGVSHLLQSYHFSLTPTFLTLSASSFPKYLLSYLNASSLEAYYYFHNSRHQIYSRLFLILISIKSFLKIHAHAINCLSFFKRKPPCTHPISHKSPIYEGNSLKHTTHRYRESQQVENRGGGLTHCPSNYI